MGHVNMDCYCMEHAFPQILGWINTSEWLQVREKIMRFGSQNGWEFRINDDLNEKVIHKWIIFYCHV